MLANILLGLIEWSNEFLLQQKARGPETCSYLTNDVWAGGLRFHFYPTDSQFMFIRTRIRFIPYCLDVPWCKPMVKAETIVRTQKIGTFSEQNT